MTGGLKMYVASGQSTPARMHVYTHLYKDEHTYSVIPLTQGHAH